MGKELEVINKWFKRRGEFIIRFRWFFIISFLILDLIAFFGVKKIEIVSSDKGLFLENDVIKKSTKLFEEYFGNNDFVAVLVEADDIFDPEVLKMIKDLSKSLLENVPFVERVISLTNFRFPEGSEEGFSIKKLVPENIPDSEKKIKKIKEGAFSKKVLVNRLFSDDSKQTWILLNLIPYPENWDDKLSDHPEHIVGKKVTDILKGERFKGFNIRATGYPVTQYESRIFFEGEARRNIIISLLVAILLLTIFLRSFRGVIFPIITTLSSILIVYGTMGYAGVKINNMVMTVPIFLGMAISIGYSVHVFNFYKYRARCTGKRRDSIIYAIEHTGWPIFFTALTTFGSLLSFSLIPIKILQWLGIATASVVIVVYFIVMTITPALLSFGKDTTKVEKYFISKQYSSETIFEKLGKFVLKHQLPIVIIISLIILVSIAGITRMRVNVDHKTTFGTKVNFIKKAHYIAGTKIGSLYSYNIILEFPEGESAKEPKVLKKLETFLSDIKGLRLTKRITSLADIIKELNQVLHSGEKKYYKIPEKGELISHLLLIYEMSGGTETEEWVDYEYKLMRIMVEINDYDSSEILKELGFLKERAKKLFPEAKVGFAGIVFRIAQIQEYIIKGELISLFIAISIICFLMMIVFKSLKAAIIGIIPNLASAALVCGVMGFFNIPLNLITMTIVPMLLGIGVDDSIHFINHMKFEVERHQKYKESILRSFRAVGYALFITSFILIAVFFIYMNSIIKMFFHFGILAIVGLTTALISTYLLTPILIKFFKPFK